MNIVTLWHHQPHPAQTQLAEYLTAAEFPLGSVFVWGLAPHTETALEPTRQALIRRGYSVDVQRFAPPSEPIKDLHSKHHRVTTLYNEVVPRLQKKTALFIEDDVIPLDLDASIRLRKLFDAAPESCAMVAAAYRSRPNPHGACAIADQYLFWDKLPVDPISIRWAGAGLTLYRTSSIQAVLPFRCQISSTTRKGWDICVAEDFGISGFSMLLAPGIRAEHRCKEVIEWCARRGCTLA